MSLSGTLTKVQIIDAVSETNGFTRIESMEAVELMLPAHGLIDSNDPVSKLIAKGYEKSSYIMH